MSEDVAQPPRERPDGEGIWKYDRFYGLFGQGKYKFPIDEEEKNRLDIFHKFFCVARKEQLLSHPLPRDHRPRVMDLGTGSGIWAIALAEQFDPTAEVYAVDLHKIQPRLIPPNLHTLQYDIESQSWDGLPRDCDVLHMRLMLGSIRDDLWTQVYRNALAHLRPGGWIEQVEIDWTPTWDGPEPPSQSYVKYWSELFLSGMDDFGRSARVFPETAKRSMEAAGLLGFTEETIKVYLNPWSADRWERETGRWLNLGFNYASEAMSFAPLIEKKGIPYHETLFICEAMKRETCFLRYHPYFTVYVLTNF
ncbi:hypothetical protein S7711_04229 [Stachybotrys chartarum IBT 7711]|uniref:Secondary metabolism regulator LAE1 n=1 Tax=Stachybotrys chartarum (strain CBS 109288 / IBT 7711) TaxID=1280523 RepID=A0A084AIL0_STACB|nr:hypothetical protein S7711_04229 [Stachybotrys chartarum IBT 7711]KFA53694.1 hypothetical protein S40293_03856 [Stachybotrys chartarum IBT 40293]KFA73110.1 hypothetical protein S40288_02799 [Stachybotrys chartarum IBT 40288]